MDTVLFIPRVEGAKEKPGPTPPPSQPIPSPATLPQESNAKATHDPLGGFLGGISILMFIIGMVLVFRGCGNEFNEAESAVRQTVCAVQYGSGFVIMTLSFILVGVVRLIRKD
jgi:hypothetical protein